MTLEEIIKRNALISHLDRVEWVSDQQVTNIAEAIRDWLEPQIRIFDKSYEERVPDGCGNLLFGVTSVTVPVIPAGVLNPGWDPEPPKHFDDDGFLEDQP